MRTRIAAAVLAALTVTGITAATIATTGYVSPAPRTIVQAEPEPLCPSLRAMCAPTPPAPVGLTDEQRAVIADEYTRGWGEVR